MFSTIITFATAFLLVIFAGACRQTDNPPAYQSMDTLRPALITQQVQYDTDDPAIWINAADPTQSLVIGTDKDSDGGIYVFDMKGRIVKEVKNLKRPNNVDIAYGVMWNGSPVDIAVVTERESNQLRVFRLPDMSPVDGGGISVFDGETERQPMGIALYTRPSDHAVFAIVGRKSGPAEGYLWQYQLADNGKGALAATLVRKFGRYSGRKEIESIAADNELGYIYYSDEQYGVHKYQADPAMGNTELALFGQRDFKEDIEGISIYKHQDGTGYILVSNQQANTFVVYPREGTTGQPHQHLKITEIPVSTAESDGSDVTSLNLGPDLPEGLFVAMSNGKVFHYYNWRDIQKCIDKAQQSQ